MRAFVPPTEVRMTSRTLWLSNVLSSGIAGGARATTFPSTVGSGAEAQVATQASGVLESASVRAAAIRAVAPMITSVTTANISWRCRGLFIAVGLRKGEHQHEMC